MSFFACRSSSEEEPKPKLSGVSLETSNNNTSGGSADLLGLGLAGGAETANNVNNNVNGNGFTQEPPTNNLTKYETSTTRHCRLLCFLSPLSKDMIVIELLVAQLLFINRTKQGSFMIL